MINSLCGSMRSPNSETAGTVRSETLTHKTTEVNDPWTKQETTSANQKINGSTENLNIQSPAVKYEMDGDIEIQSPDYSLLKSIFSDDHQTLQGDFMVYSPPRIFSPLNQRSSKGPSPLHRVFNSPNIQYMSVDNLSLPPLENIPADEEDDAFIVFSPMKITGGNGESSSNVMQENDIYGLGSSVHAPLSQQLHQEWQQEHQQRYLQQQQAQQPQLRCLPAHQSQSHNMQNSILMVPVPGGSEEVYDSGLHLVHLLLVTAEAISKEDYMLARKNLHYLNRLVSPLGDSMQRVAACFTEALTARLTAILTNKLPSTSITRNPPFNTFPDPKSPEILKIYQILYQACPYIKFAHFTANQAIFEAFESQTQVHVIDLDILQGYQWPAFMQALAARPGGAPFLRITGVGPSLADVRETGRALNELAHSLHVPFEFHPIGGQLEELKPHMFIRKVGEALAVNSISRLHSVPRDRLGNILTLIRNLAPNIVTIVEQESSHNGPYFLGRFLEALHYYSAIFDSLDATFPPDSAQRDKVEQHIFAPQIRNIIASEGQDRVIRHERLEKWRRHMEGKGFKAVPLSPNAVTQSKILLSLYSCEGYKLTQDRGCLLLGWQDRAILAASSWTC